MKKTGQEREKIHKEKGKKERERGKLGEKETGKKERKWR